MQAAGRIAPGNVLIVDRAIHLLVHLEELVDGVAGIGVIGHGRAGQLERPGRQGVDVGDAGIRAHAVWQTGAAGSEQELVGGGQSGIAARQAENGSAGGFCTPARSGAGSIEYSDLLADPALMKYLPPFGAEVT